jgi:hypothetical protein
MRARLSRCSRAIEERVLRSQSACPSHCFLAPSGTRLFLHFAQRTPVATTLCSCMIVHESGSLKHVKRKTPVLKHHRVLLTTDIALSLAALHTPSPMPPIAAPVAKPIYSSEDSNGLCAELAILDPTTFPASELHVPLSSIGEFSCCGLTRSRPTFVFVPQNARPRVKPALICFSRNPWTAIYMEWPGLVYSSPNRHASLPQPIDGNTQRAPKAAAPGCEPPMSRSMNRSGHPGINSSQLAGTAVSACSKTQESRHPQGPACSSLSQRITHLYSRHTDRTEGRQCPKEGIHASCRGSSSKQG